MNRANFHWWHAPRKSTTSIVATLAIAVAACGDDTPTQPRPPGALSAAEAAATRSSLGRAMQAAHAGIDGQFLRLADSVAGFGGYYYDSNGNVTLVLRSLTNTRAAEAAVRRLARDGRLTGARMGFQQAEYGIRDLVIWKDALTLALFERTRGVVWVDADEVRNRVVVGLADMTEMSLVQALMDAAGVPRAAVVVKPTGRITFTTKSLSDYHRPVTGALRAQVIISATQLEDCTLGWIQPGHSGRVYGATASHCSASPFEPDAGFVSTVYQPADFAGWDLGQESIDPLGGEAGTQYPDYNPPTYTFVCPQGFRCRLSDAMYFQFSDPANARIGELPRMIGWPSPAPGERNYDETNPLRFVGGLSEPVTVGGSYMKLGNTTGFRQGSNLISCVSARPTHPTKPLPNVYLACQQIMNAVQEQGDSGGPVFIYHNADEAKLAGIAWGRYVEGDAVYTLWSDNYNITEELRLPYP